MANSITRRAREIKSYGRGFKIRVKTGYGQKLEDFDLKASCLAEFISTVRALASKGLSPATGGNFSLRLSSDTFFITRSGTDKAELSESDILTCNLEGQISEGEGEPSAETLIHAALYQLSEETTSVLHTHSVSATVLSALADHEIVFKGYEMQKSISGCKSHEEPIRLKVLENSQEMKILHDYLVSHADELQGDHGFLLKQHGLYAWGNSLFEAKRHIEGFEFLLECELARRMLER